MSRSRRRWPLLIGIIAGLCLVSLAISWLFTLRSLGPPPLRNLGQTSEGQLLKQLDADLVALHNDLRELESVPEPSDPELADLRNDLMALRSRAEEMRVRQSGEGVLLDLAGEAAGQSLSAVSGMMTFMSILFTVVLFGVALLSGLQLIEAKRDMERIQTVADQQASRLDAVRSSTVGYETKLVSETTKFEETLNAAKSGAEEQASRIRALADDVSAQRAASEAFLNNLIDVHASAVLDLLDGLTRGSHRSRSRRFQHLVDKGQELKGRLLLLHPDLERRRAGILLLSAVGSRKSHVELLRLLRSDDTDKELALLIRSAIASIEEREGSVAGSAAPVPAKADTAQR